MLPTCPTDKARVGSGWEGEGACACGIVLSWRSLEAHVGEQGRATVGVPSSMNEMTPCKIEATDHAGT